MANNELTAGAVKEIVEEIVDAVVRREVGGLRVEMNEKFEVLGQNTADGFAQVITTIDSHMLDTERKFTSDRKRIERLEKAVIF